MSSVYLDPVQRNGAQHRPLSALLLMAMLAVTGVSVVCATAPTLLGVSTGQPSSLAQCTDIAAGAARLACYDHLGHAASGAPAKGALAPPSTAAAR